MKILLFAFIGLFINCGSNARTPIDGAWSMSSGSQDIVYIILDDYLVYSSYDKTNKTFNVTWGGVIKMGDGKFTLHTEFNSGNSDEVGKDKEFKFRMEDDKLALITNDIESKLVRIDDGKGDLAGNWRISARMQEGKMSPINPGPRKTLKILSATRFQWIAINTETKEFFGTGGGTYTFKDGKYTENIEFFSRDGSRVGATLVFDGRVENGVWVHSGLNSRGEKLREEWRRE
jgi:hypothetical protein